MKRSVLTASQAVLLRKLVLRYKGAAKPAKPWNRRTPDELWRKVLGAIATQGNARAGFVIEGSYEAKRQTSLSRLREFRTETELLRHIHWVLATVGTRYVRKSFLRDPKSKAARQNYHVLLKAGGPKRFFRSIAGHRRSEIARIEALQDSLAFYGPKTARDTAIELGLAKNCMALDVRLRTLLAAVGAHTDGASYEEMEWALISKVARPVKLTGAQLDRILFRNYDMILADLKLAANRR